MKFYCDRCNAKYSIADEKVRGKIVKVRCKRCSDIITVSEDTNRAHQSLPGTGSGGGRSSVSSGGPGKEWYYSVQGETYGPIGEKALVEKYRSGEVSANSYVWREGFGDWDSASSVEPFSSALEESAAKVGDTRLERKSTMGVGDSIEAVEPAGEDSSATPNSAREGSSREGTAGEGRSSGRARSGRESRSRSSSRGSRKRRSDRRNRERSRGTGRNSEQSRERSRESSSAGQGSSSKSSNRRERDRRSRRRRDRGSSGEGGDRNDRLRRLRDKLKSDFGSGSRDESRASESGEIARSPAEGERSPESRETPDRKLERSGGSQAAEVDSNAGVRDSSPGSSAVASGRGGGVEQSEPKPQSADEILSGLEVEDETSKLSRERLEEITDTAEESGVELGANSPVSESVAEADSAELEGEAGSEAFARAGGAEEESGGFSLPPAGSARIGEEERESEPDPDSEPEEAEATDESSSFDEAASEPKAALPSAPKLGDSEEESAKSSVEGVTQSLLIQLDKIKKEDRGHRWIGGAAALAMLLLGAGIGYYLWMYPDAPETDGGKEEVETVVVDDNSNAEQKTYSSDKHQQLLELKPQEVGSEKKEREGESSDSRKLAKNEQGQTDDGPLAPGRGVGDEGESMDEAFEGAKKRGSDRGKRTRELDEGRALGSSSSDGPSSEDFEAMRAIEGSSPRIESPTESLKGRNSGNGASTKLTKEQIRKGIQGVRKSVGDCRRRHARRGVPIDTQKIYVTLSVEPSGSVSEYTITPEKLEGSVLERCLASHTGRWSFGPFEGSTQKIKAPFIMQ